MTDPVPASRPLRVLVVDADHRVRASLADLIRLGDGVELVGEAGHPLAAIEACDEVEPDVVIVDPRLPDVDGGLALIRALRVRCPSACVIALSWSDSLENDAIASGADALVPKSLAPGELVERILALGSDALCDALCDAGKEA